MMLKTFMIACLSVVVLASGVFAQTTPPAPNPNQGVFDQLSPGNQKIAQALFDAQRTTTTKSLSRDDIAAMKQDGKGWGEVFKEMKQQGLVDAKNLGQVVSQANHAARSSAKGTMITTGSGRSYVAGAGPKPEYRGAGGEDHGRTYRDNQGKGGGDHGRPYVPVGGQSYSDGGISGGNSGNGGLGNHGGRGKN